MNKRKVIFVVIVLACLECSWSYSIKYRRPCHDLSPECLKNSFQSAIPIFANGSAELGLEPLDPYVLQQLNLTLPGVQIQFSQGYANGLKTCVVDFARYVDDTLEVQVHCNLSIQGNYKSRGSLLVFQIDGDGLSTIKCDNLKLHSVVKLGTKEKNGQRYFDIKNSVVKHAYDGRVTYKLTNLFKNNAEMSKVVLRFMNRNWRLIAEEFGTPIVEYGINAIMKNIRHFFDTVPIEELVKL